MKASLPWLAPFFLTLLLVGCPDSNESGSSSGTSGNPEEDGGIVGEDGSAPDGTTENPAAKDAFPATVSPNQPAVARGAAFGKTSERFNRHYTDPAAATTKTLYVSPTGTGDGSSAGTPASVTAAIAAATPGTRVVFQKGTYAGCYDITNKSGTYDAPIVFYGERNGDGTRGVRIDCCASASRSCFNLYAADYIAVDGFDLRGGKYGVRIEGADYAASKHLKGVAVLDNVMDAQTHDGVLSGKSDWSVFENNTVSNSGAADGHGIYVSDGSDWSIVRRNDLFGNQGATFQVNADPLSTCKTPYNNAACDAIAGTEGDGGRGASDYLLIEANYFHHGTSHGPNFTSMRYSNVRNNVFAAWANHGVSFWSETADPKDATTFNANLGSHHNLVHHNLFATTNAQYGVQFIANSDSCDVRNNVFVGLNANAVAVETDTTVPKTVFENNVYIAASLDGRSAPSASEKVVAKLEDAWFTKVPRTGPSVVGDWVPKTGAPFLDLGPAIPALTLDREGKPRGTPADLGPFELP